MIFAGSEEERCKRKFAIARTRSPARQTREVTLLKTDVSYLETIARDRLDLMKEGETIFCLETARAKAKPVAPVRK